MATKWCGILSTRLAVHQDRFLAFTAPFIAGPEAAPLRLKVEHSLRVFKHVQTLVHAESPTAPYSTDNSMGGPMSTRLAHAAMLAGLYHDCGRFPQFRRYQTFLDSASANHARLGLAVIREQKFLEDEPDVRHLVQAAVLLHNRFALPDRLDPQVRLITDMVRDADKLDILRVMVEYLEGALPEKDTVLLNVRDEPDKWSPVVMQDVMNGKVARYSDLHYVNDFRLLLGTWLHDLRFPATREALRRSKLMDSVLQGLPDTPEMRSAKAYLGTLAEGGDATESNASETADVPAAS